MSVFVQNKQTQHLLLRYLLLSLALTGVHSNCILAEHDVRKPEHSHPTACQITGILPHATLVAQQWISLPNKVILLMLILTWAEFLHLFHQEDFEPLVLKKRAKCTIEHDIPSVPTKF